MRKQILMTILPPISGILVVLIILALVNIILQNDKLFDSSQASNAFFFRYMVPFAVFCAMVIQFTLAMPFWERFKLYGKVWGLNLFPFMALNCLISGIIFGLVFWERSYGLPELFLVAATGIVAFSIYWSVNLYVLWRLDR